jgi:hypothetical protein
MVGVARAAMVAGSLAVMGGLAAGASAASGIAGDWNGTLAVAGQSLKLVFHFRDAGGGKLSGTVDSPNQGPQAMSIPIKTVTFSGGKVRADVKKIFGVYTGQLGTDGESLSGQWRQGQTLPLALQRAGKGSGAAGDWRGTLKTPKHSVRMVIHLRDSGGKLTGSLDSPDQGPSALGFPADKISFKDGKLHLESSKLHAVYTAQLSKDGTTFSGDWWQGIVVPLSLKRSQ